MFLRYIVYDGRGRHHIFKDWAHTKAVVICCEAYYELSDYFACTRVISVYYLEPTSLNILKIIPPSSISISFEVQTRLLSKQWQQQVRKLVFGSVTIGVSLCFLRELTCVSGSLRLHKMSKLKPTSLCKSCTALSEFDWLIADYYNVWERMFLFEKDTGKSLGFCESIMGNV